MSFVARLGGILWAPRRALAAASAAPPGRGIADLAWLLGARLLAFELPRLAIALLRVRLIDLESGLTSFVSAFETLFPHVLAVLLGGTLMALFVPRRSVASAPGADALDVAAYAMVPFVTVELLGTLVEAAIGHRLPFARLFEGAGLSWAAVVWTLGLLALRRARSTPPPESAISGAAGARDGGGARGYDSWAGGLLLSGLAVLAVYHAVFIARHPDMVKELALVGTHPGGEAPEVRLRLLDGKEISLTQLRGHPVALAFWATWCGPCREELPSVDRLAAKLAPDAQVIAVNVEEAELKPRVEEYVRKAGLHLPVAWGGQDAAAAYHVDLLPTLVVIDREGRVSQVLSGVHSEETVHTAIDRASARGAK